MAVSWVAPTARLSCVPSSDVSEISDRTSRTAKMPRPAIGLLPGIVQPPSPGLPVSRKMIGAMRRNPSLRLRFGVFRDRRTRRVTPSLGVRRVRPGPSAYALCVPPTRWRGSLRAGGADVRFAEVGGV
ncbi:hypothetical protein Axi01nite_16090 [Actinoplanes xinjiangensis]|nr:hypothetical protein Axi01nite_16090 [Actinoplanes xinjiangensis]